MLATEYASYFGVEAQREGESDIAFRSRVASELRKASHIIEANEAYYDAYYDQSEDVTTGIVGFLAQAMQGVEYGGSDESKIDTDYAAGVVAQNPRDDGIAAILLALLSQR